MAKQISDLNKPDHRDPRRSAYEIMIKVAEEGSFIDRELLSIPDGTDSRDRAFIMRMVRGTIERMIEMDAVIDHYAKTPVRRQKKQIRNILRLAVYQIAYMDSVPDSAAVNEAVKLTRQVRLSQLSGFVNGILRALCRDVEKTGYSAVLDLVCQDIEKKDQASFKEEDRYPGAFHSKMKDVSTNAKALSIRYSMPLEITEMWLKKYGEEKTEQILKAFLADSPLTLRIDTNRISLQEYAMQVEQYLCSKGSGTEQSKKTPKAANESIKDVIMPSKTVVIDKSSILNESIIINDNADVLPHIEMMGDLNTFIIHASVNPEELPGYADGLFYVQNISAMAPVDHAGIKSGDKVLDVCAAPGGKSIQAAILTGEKGHVVSCDLSSSRADTIRENVARMHMNNIDVQVRDASIDIPSEHEVYDVVFADLPCSGLGVLNRKPESKYRFNQIEIESLISTNRCILETVSSYVRPGGTLVYSTCTINTVENEEIISWFTNLHSEYTLMEEQQILPTTDGRDGFFYAVLRRQ